MMWRTLRLAADQVKATEALRRDVCPPPNWPGLTASRRLPALALPMCLPFNAGRGATGSGVLRSSFKNSKKEESEERTQQTPFRETAAGQSAGRRANMLAGAS